MGRLPGLEAAGAIYAFASVPAPTGFRHLLAKGPDSFVTPFSFGGDSKRVSRVTG